MPLRSREMSTHPVRHEFLAVEMHAVQDALIFEAERLHEHSPTGLDPRAHKLHAKVLQRRLSADGAVLILSYWVMIEPTRRKYRASFIRVQDESRLTASWERCPWPFKGKHLHGQERPLETRRERLRKLK